jgi:polyisoprenyl-teichoic acid--peptidoglycan teichoic acid transferase
LTKQLRVQYKKSKKGKKKRKKLKIIVYLLLLIILGVIGYTAYILYSAYQAANESFEELERGEKSKLREEMVEISKDPFSILLMGVETYSSGGTVGRSDSLIVATLNPKDQTMKLLSIPRDTRVFIPEKNITDKINHAYVYGQKELTIETVEQLLQIPIDYYATVSFEGFKNIIDEIGGVTVEVPFDFWEESDTRPRRKIYFKEGEMKLNGEEALAYARMRKRDPRGDFGRNERQKQIIVAAIDKLKSPSIVFKIDDIAKHIGENVETNLSISKALALQKVYSNLDSSKIEKLSISGNDLYIDGVYYFDPDPVELDKIRSTLKAHLNQDASNGSLSAEQNLSQEN